MWEKTLLSGGVRERDNRGCAAQNRPVRARPADLHGRERTFKTGGGRKSDGNVLSPAARSYIFTARLCSTRFVPGILEISVTVSSVSIYRKKIRTTSQLNKLFSRSRRYRSNRGHMSLHVPTMVIASSRRFGTCGSSILPSAIAFFLSTSRALTS
jgi:hypothetical protein